MYGEYELREVALSVGSQRRDVEAFLSSNGLRLDPLDTFVGIFDSADEFVGGGGLKGNVIKCVAISPALRSGSLANALISRLREKAFSDGHDNVFVFTKPENEAIFRSLAFHTVARSDGALLLESDPRGVSSFAERLGKQCRKGRNGIIVMHGNPLTLGHLHLIRTASAQSDNLYVILLSDDDSVFSCQERHEMARNATSDLPNVVIIDGGQYIISAATFPSYFIKDASKAADAQIGLDLDIFRRHIIPALNVSVRFVGSEPLDPLTNRYNERMKQLADIEIIEVPRLKIGDEAVSASLVRSLIDRGEAARAFSYVPPTTFPYIVSHAAAAALSSELELTPKPGLVDRHDNGAHKDMDFALMERSIYTLLPYFTELAELGLKTESPTTAEIRAVGVRAEEAMLAATRGVNTHRGALFSMGMAIAATAMCLRQRGKVDGKGLQDNIMRLAAGFAPAVGTHGDEVKRKYNIAGAVAMAQSGYAPLFEEWLPFCRANATDDEGRLKLLLLIMSRLDDTNIYYRCGKDAAIEVKELSLQLLRGFSAQALRDANDMFTSRNISPGGAADMLALTLFAASVTSE